MQFAAIAVIIVTLFDGDHPQNIKQRLTGRGMLAVLPLSPQQIAKSRASYMAINGLHGHAPKQAGDWQAIKTATFEGVGWTKTKNAKNVATCQPDGTVSGESFLSKKLLGDASVSSEHGTFRVRIWGERNG